MSVCTIITNFVYMRTIYAIALSLCLLAGVPSAAAVVADVKTPVELTVRKGLVKVSNGGDEAVEVYVYAITGALVSKFSVEPGAEETIELSTGYYIVKAGDITRRVAI